MYAEYSDVIKFDDLPDPRDTWDLLEKIGEGTYGEVYSARHKHTGEVVAVKILDSLHEVMEEIEEEYRVLEELSHHNNLPTFHGLYLKQDSRSEDQLWIALELCSGGSVTDLVKMQLSRNHTMEEILIAHIVKETMKGLQHLHSNNVMHRDVKGHNILLTPNADIKLVDFGVSGHLQETLGKRRTSVGTPYWMAPEVIACEQQLEYEYDVRCDVWSLGVTAIELADGEPPWNDHHPMRALFKIPRSPPPSVREPNRWSNDFMDFIQRCVVKDFEKRPFLAELFNHPFISQVPEDAHKLQEQLKEMILDSDKGIHEPYVTTKHGRLRSKRKSKREPISAVDDLATLDNLEEEVIVNHLEQRYNKNNIYTYIGDILLAVNPFCPLPIYSQEQSKLYRNVNKADLPPHIYATADQSYHMMMHNKHSQCIVISGESGSGKTESANFLLQQLTLLGRAPNRTLEDKILQVNPLVEAFGNAKTVINDNSSRFGKYLEMTFTTNGKVTGARLSEYLLEKSRVIRQSPREKSFHIFYYIHDGLSHDDKLGKYHLKDQPSYRYLNGHSKSGSAQSSVSNNRAKFRTIHHCFETIGFKTQEVNAIYSILVAILHIGNITFLESESKHQTLSKVHNTDLIDIVSDLLGIDGKELQEALTTSGIVARGETIIRNNSVSESVNIRDAMSKAMYGRLFSWIVCKINTLLKPARSAKTEDESYSIGILDIFGFENFERNSFEQLCINIANEQIQYYFNQHIFAWEQQEYENEGIDADLIQFVDNRPVLDMFLTKPVGLLSLLDEESNFPKATDYTLVEKFQQNIQAPFFSRPKSQGLKFTVEHYAGKVEYDSSGFLEKNRDRLASEIVSVLRLSQIALVRTLFNSPINKTGNLAYNTLGSGGSSSRMSPVSSVGSSLSIRSATNSTASQSRSQQTVATYFRYSLMDLLSKMVTGTPHFIRCIRPNVENSPGYFDQDKVVLQLRYTGVLETTRIRRQGYSHRIPFSEFLKRYYILGYDFNEKVRVNRDSCRHLLEKIGLQNWALGKTKVFLKYYHIEQLSRKFEEQQRKVILAQAMMRGWIQKRRYKKQREQAINSAITIQRVARGYLARKLYRPQIERRTRAITLLQAATRGYLQRHRYLRYKDAAYRSVVTIQSAFRGFQTRQRLRLDKMRDDTRFTLAATVLQKYFRMWKAQAQFVHMQLYGDRGGTNIYLAHEESDDAYSPLVATPVANQPVMSPERYEHLEQARLPKSPCSEHDAGYYDMLSEENRSRSNTWRKHQGRLKQPTSAEGRQYYDSLVAEIQKKDQEMLPMINTTNQPAPKVNFIINRGSGSVYIPGRLPRTRLDSRNIQPKGRLTKSSLLRYTDQSSCTLHSTQDWIDQSAAGLHIYRNDVSLSDASLEGTIQSDYSTGSRNSVDDSPYVVVQYMASPPNTMAIRHKSSNDIKQKSSNDIKQNLSAPVTNWSKPGAARGNKSQLNNQSADFTGYAQQISQPIRHSGNLNQSQPTKHVSPCQSETVLLNAINMDQSATRSHSGNMKGEEKRDKSKRMIGRSERNYQAQSMSNGVIKHDSGVYDAAPSGNRSSQRKPESGDHSNVAVSDVFRTVMATSAASKLVANKPGSANTSSSSTPPGGMQKSESTFSLAWDDVLEEARKKALAPDTIQENTAEIQIAFDDDEFVYKEELLQEQEEQREELIRSLEIQQKNSLSARLARHQTKSREQQNRETQWNQIHSMSEERDESGEESDKESAYKRILRPPGNRGNHTPDDKPDVNKTDSKAKLWKKLATPTALVSQSQKSKQAAPTASPSQSEEGEPGVFNFRAHLRKTNQDLSKTLRKSQSEDEEGHIVDYRSVLKKRSLSALHKHVLAN